MYTSSIKSYYNSFLIKSLSRAGGLTTCPYLVTGDFAEDASLLSVCSMSGGWASFVVGEGRIGCFRELASDDATGDAARDAIESLKSTQFLRHFLPYTLIR